MMYSTIHNNWEIGRGIWDLSPNSTAGLILFRDEYQRVWLYANVCEEQKPIEQSEIISVDENPELFNLWNWDESCWNSSEVFSFIDGIEECPM